MSSTKCYVNQNLRQGVWFTDSNLKLQDILLITYFWAEEIPHKNTMKELIITSQTVVNWNNLLRFALTYWYSPQEKLGVLSILTKSD